MSLEHDKKKLELINEMNNHIEQISGAPSAKSREEKIRSSSTAALIRKTADLMREDLPGYNETGHVKDYLKISEQIVNMDSLKRGSLPMEQILNVYIQILRGEDTPGDINALKDMMQSVEDSRKQMGGSGAGGGGGNGGASGTGGGRDSQSNSVISQLGLIKEANPLLNNSYSSSDIVASINIPNGPKLVVGELLEISYSVLREKKVARSLGSQNPKGFAYGGRFITGSLVFAMFDHSIVYNIMKEYSEAGYPIMMDEMPLFNIDNVMANEYGNRSRMTIHGVTIVREGFVAGVNDIMLNNAFDFFALDITPLETLGESFKGSSGGA